MRRQCSCVQPHSSSSSSTSTSHNRTNPHSTTVSSANTSSNQWTWSVRTTANSIHIESDEPLPGEIEEEKREFHAYFARHVSTMIQKLSERFPYRHVIHWSMHITDQCQHDLNIEVRAPRPTN